MVSQQHGNQSQYLFLDLYGKKHMGLPNGAQHMYLKKVIFMCTAVDGSIYRENFHMRSAVENQIKNSDLELFDRSVSRWSELPQQDFDIYR